MNINTAARKQIAEIASAEAAFGPFTAAELAETILVQFEDQIISLNDPHTAEIADLLLNTADQAAAALALAQTAI